MTSYNEKRDKIVSELGKYVDAKRIPHVMGVEKKAIELAEMLHLDDDSVQILSISALLHDITKKWSNNEHLEYLKKSNIDFENEYSLSPKTLHELTGGYFSAEIFPDILSVGDEIFLCISSHTTGSGYNPEIKQIILFLADYIEDTRTFPECVELRDYFVSLSKKMNPESALLFAYKKALEMTIKELKEQKNHIHSKTLNALNGVNNLIKKKRESKMTMENNEMSDILKAETLAKKIVSILDAHKAGNIKLLKVTEKTIIADYFVICSGNSNTQVRGICDEVEYKLSLENIAPVREEGLDTCTWSILDFSSVILHVFNTETRKYYNLERLWAEAEEVDISSILTED